MIKLKLEIMENELHLSVFMLQSNGKEHTDLFCTYTPGTSNTSYINSVCFVKLQLPWSCFRLPHEVGTWQRRQLEKGDYGFRSQPCCIIHSTSLQISPHLHLNIAIIHSTQHPCHVLSKSSSYDDLLSRKNCFLSARVLRRRHHRKLIKETLRRFI